MRKFNPPLLVLALLVGFVPKMFAQFTPTPATGGASLSTAAINAGVGVGNWPNAVNTNARLHVNNFYCASPGGILSGKLFRTDGHQGLDNQWQMFTGANVASLTQKGRIYTSPNSTTQGAPGLQPNNQNFAYNHFAIEAPEGDIIFRSRGSKDNGGNPGILQDRLRITSVYYLEPNVGAAPGISPNYTRVGISSGQQDAYGGGTTQITSPLAMLHIGDPSLYAWAGHRDWMNYGTFVGRGSDMMYIGVRQNEDPQYVTNNDKTEAIIAWGDNPQGASNNQAEPNLDHLRIIFNASYGAGGPNATGKATGENGLEAMRFVPLSLNHFGQGPGNDSKTVYVGIGDFSVNNALFPFGDPARKLEILSDKFTATANGNPQLRLTHDQQNPNSAANTGKYADFHSTNPGDLAIQTFDNTQTNTTAKVLQQRFVGVNTNTPGNTVEINSQYQSTTTPGASGFSTVNGQPAGGFSNASGWAGLRFTDLTSSSYGQANPGAGLLSVNNSGDVIYVPTLGNFCGAANRNPLTNNYEIYLRNHNFIFSDTSNGTGKVGIGKIAACAPGNLLEVNNGTTAQLISGLRLTDLKSAPAATAFGANGNVLSVNPATGDVILVKDQVGTGGGGTGITQAQNGLSINPSNSNIVELGGLASSASAAALLNDREIPMATKTVLFSGDGTFKVGKQVAVANTAGAIPTMEVNNSFNTANNIGLYVKDNGLQGQTNRQGVKIEMNLNNGDPQTSALDISNSDPNPQTSNAYLIKAKGINYGTAGVVEKFLLDNYGNSGFNMPVGSYNQAAMTVEDYYNVPFAQNPYYAGNGPLYKTMMVNSVVINSNLANQYAVSTAIEAYCKGNNGTAYGITAVGESFSTQPNRQGIGVKATGIANSTTGSIYGAYGVYADALPAAANAAAKAYGVYGLAKNSTTANYGIYGVAAISTSSPTNFAGYFDGDVNITNNLYANGGTHITSDQMFKTNVDTINNPLAILKQLKPRTFFMDTANAYGIKFSGKKQYGFIAQDVQTVLPELISGLTKPADMDSLGNIIHQAVTYKNLDYNAFLGLLTAAMQKQQAHIEHQDSVINQMAQTMNSCCNTNARTTQNDNNFAKNPQEIKLTLPISISMSEAHPNPNNGKAEIDYYIPTTITSAKIIFTDLMGRNINESKLSIGYGTLVIDTKELPSGIYGFTLIADGKVIDTKKMMKQD